MPEHGVKLRARSFKREPNRSLGVGDWAGGDLVTGGKPWRKVGVVRCRGAKARAAQEVTVRDTLYTAAALVSWLMATASAGAQAPFPIDIDPDAPPITFARVDIEAAIDAMVVEALATQDRLRWGHISGSRVEVSQAERDVLHIDLDLAANVMDPIPDPEVDVDFYIRIIPTTDSLRAELIDMTVLVNYPWYVDLATLGAADTIAALVSLVYAPELALAERSLEQIIQGFGFMFPGLSVRVNEDGSVRFYFDTWRGEWAPVGQVATCYNGYSGIDGRVEIVNGEMSISVSKQPWSPALSTTIQTWTRIPGQGDLRGPSLSTYFAPETIRVPAPAGVTHVLCDAIDG